MLEALAVLFAEYNNYAKANPVLAGVMSLWGLTVLSWFGRNIPAKIWKFIKSQSVTTITFDDADRYGYTMKNFASFMTWFAKQKWAKYARSISMDSLEFVDSDVESPSDTMNLSVGMGNHYFFYKRRLCRLNRTVEKGRLDRIVNMIEITVFSRNRALVMELINEFRYQRPPDQSCYYLWRHEQWCLSGTLVNRDLKTIAVSKEVLEEIIGTIDRFKNNRDRYTLRGIAYKLAMILHGKHGGGKTSIIRALATYYRMNIAVLNISEHDDRSFQQAASSVPKNTMLLIEDYDSEEATKQRKIAKRARLGNPDADNLPPLPNNWTSSPGGYVTGSYNPDETPEEDDDEKKTTISFRSMTLSGILNAIDGIIALDDVIIMLTTNNLYSTDRAMLRKGRIDKIVEIVELTHKEILYYFSVMFPEDVVPSNYRFKNIMGADLQDLYLTSEDDFNVFLESIPRIQPVLNQAA